MPLLRRAARPLLLGAPPAIPNPNPNPNPNPTLTPTPTPNPNPKKELLAENDRLRARNATLLERERVRRQASTAPSRLYTAH